MNTGQFLPLIMIIAAFSGCTPNAENPPSDGFNAASSDPKAIEIADEVMKAMGSRQAWDDTHIIAWDFFGARKLVWDKQTGNVRIDNLKNDQTVLLNVNTDKGKVFQDGKEVENPDSVAKYVKKGKSNWINDMYWLLMPFKLKDAGLTLKYSGTDTTQTGKQADKLLLTFKEVGDTPDNKYYVWVDKSSHLVSQWAYYPKSTDEEPMFITPWADYKKHDNLMLSGDRGEKKLSDIMVFTSLPDDVFTKPARPDLTQYPQAE